MNIFIYLMKNKKFKVLFFLWGIVITLILSKFLRFKLIGTNSYINIYPCLSPLLGLVLGELYGSLVVILLFIYYLVFFPKALYFGLLSPLPTLLSVIIAGYLCKGNWKIPAIIYGFGLLVFFILAYPIFYYAIFSIIALGMILTIRDKFLKFLFDNDIKKVCVGALKLSFVCVMCDHLYGSILGLVILKIPYIDYVRAIPSFILERTVMTIIGAFFLVFIIEFSKEIIKNSNIIKNILVEEIIRDSSVNSTINNNIDKELLKKYNITLPTKEDEKKAVAELVNILISKRGK